MSGVLYVVGGFDEHGRSSSDVLFSKGDGWATGPGYPIRVDHPAAATLGDALVVAGGFTDGRARPEVYTFAGQGWEPMAPLRHARGALALVGLGGRLYALGGNGGPDLAAVEVYDPAQKAWSDIATLPVPRNHVAGFAWHGLACVAGGRFPTSSRVDCFDPATGTWSRLPDLPLPTAGAGAIGTGDDILVAGGENATESSLVDQVARFRDGAWTTEKMQVPRHGLQLALFGDRVWACGGATRPGYQASNVCTSLALRPAA